MYQQGSRSRLSVRGSASRPAIIGPSPYCIARALTSAKKGELNDGFAFAGASAYRVDKITSVHELVESLLEEYERAMVA